MELEGIRQKVFLDRYSLKDEKGSPIEETPDQMWRRVARGIAQVEKGKNRKKWEDIFYHAMEGFKFVPGGRVLAGAGTGYAVTYYNCFVIPSPPDSRDGILDNLKAMIEIMARGGGVGVNISSLRPKGSRVKKVNGFSSGPCNWAEMYSLATHDIIQQGGSRRGALMLMLWDWHPDIEEFITVKQDLTRINGANLSVCASDKFMEAVKNDKDWDLVFPDIDDPEYDQKWDGVLDHWKGFGKKVKVYKTVKARYLWNLICEAAWKSAEPGLVFMERYNKWYNNYYWNTINCVNPCLTGDILVATTKGLKLMRDLYENKLPFTAVVDGKYYLSSQVKLTGIKPVYLLKTKEGYEIRLTSDHKVYTHQGKIQAGKLKKGDKIFLSTGGAFGVNGTLEEGKVLGWLVGDGSVKEDVVTLFFYGKEKEELAPQFALMVEKMVEGEQIVARSYPILPQYIEKENKAVVESVRLWRIANRFGLTHENKYIVPQKVFEGSEEFQRGFLQGLFSSDGSVQGTMEKGVSIRLTSISSSLLVNVQRLLLNFGIVSKLYFNRRLEQKRLLPDCQAYHELVISKTSLIKFAALIGFLQSEKQEKLRTFLSLYTRGPYTESFLATFISLEEDGVEEVFDITVDKVHRFSANGLIVSNCGEEGLPNWGVCNLASLNLSTFVKDYSVDKAGWFDYESLAKHARIAVRFQDNVIDADHYVYPEIEEMQKNGERRIGLGTLGLADALIKMHLRYGSEEALPVVDKIYKTIRDGAYDESVEIAREKGPFPKINIKKHLEGYFIKQLPLSIRKKMAKHGVRNSVLLQAAPTGTTSLLSGASSGIEPVYEFEYYHTGRLGKQLVYHSLYGEWREAHPQEERPGYFVSANDLTPQDHVKIQAVVQRYVDASISKTVNAPNSHTVSDVKNLYTLAYSSGCKGITYMRDGSRAGVLVRAESPTVQQPASGNGQTILQVPLVVPNPVVRRPDRLEGVTYKIETPVGRAFITINNDEKKEPFELFITIGKSGSDVSAMTEALGRMISLNLRLAVGLTPRERIRHIIAHLSGIGGARSVGFGENRVRSLPDGVAKVLARHFGFRVNGLVEDKQSLRSDELKEVTVAENGHTGETSPAQEELHALTNLFDICPECGAGSLAYEEGCKKCYSCGYSEC